MVTLVKPDSGFVRRAVQIGEEFELHHGLPVDAVRHPSPDTRRVWFKLRVAKRVLEASGVDRSARDLEIDLDIDIGGASVTPTALGA